MIKRKFTTLFLFLFLFAGISVGTYAQQTPKKPTTAKSGTKKTGTQKKVTKKSGSVFICDAANGYTYHTRKTCKELSKCKGRVLELTKQEATSNYGRKPCKNCN